METARSSLPGVRRTAPHDQGARGLRRPVSGETRPKGVANASPILYDTCRYASIWVDTDMTFYRLADAARQVGVSPITLKRWLIAKKVAEVRRDRNGWRVFTEEDISRILVYARSVREPEDR